MSVQELLVRNDLPLYLNAQSMQSSLIDSAPGNPLFIGDTNASNIILGNLNGPTVLRGNPISMIATSLIIPNASDPNTAYSFSSSQQELTLTYSLSGAYVQANAGTLKIRRIGNWVDIYIKQSVYGIIVNPGSGLISNIVIPVNYRPLTVQSYPCIIKDNGSNFLTGLMSINIDGTFNINILTTNWTIGNQAGLITFAICYPIA